MKKHTLVIYLSMLSLLSSCGVYSLFPIYTKDTLVEKKEIIGKWLSDTEGSYLSFTRISYTVKPNDEQHTVSDEKMSITFGDENKDVVDIGDYIIEKGDTTVRKDTILSQFTEMLQRKVDGIQNLNTEDLSAKSDTYYVMNFYEKNEMVGSFAAHLVQIGEDFFIDLLPKGGLDEDNSATANYFPVHTFLKFKLEGDQLEIKMFDQNKLKDLFKSNLIRLRHELVDDKVLITAQPKEIQKFLEKYSRDESVFEDITIYKKANS
ncbi:MAG: hypothetical protein WBA74_27885 [Cyclobacteriaceae bacterium]